MKKRITLFLLLTLIFPLVSPVFAAVKTTGKSVTAVAEKFRAELKVEAETIREVDGKFIFTGQVQVSFYDPAGFEIKDVKAAILNYRSSDADVGQVVPLMLAGQGSYEADVLLTKKGDLHLQVSMILESGEKRDFDFHYAI